ncbi:hypothetical protein AN219_18645 [Streptomyces nanshensis]|nr:hypothetical protein AN219_18645 [Streptomyces nanshensis]
MSYRPGVYVVDRRRNKLGRVVGNDGPYLLLRPPAGGVEWNCPPESARLSTPHERREARIAANDG